LQSYHEPTAPPAKLPIHQPETRTNSKTSHQPIENCANSKKLQQTDRKLERTVENFKLLMKTQTNGGKLEFTEQSSNERWKMVAPAHNQTKTSRTHVVDGDRFYTAPRWAPDDPAG